MTASREVEVSQGIVWETMSDGMLSNGPIVCVPIRDIDRMTNEQIGVLARKAMWAAKLALAANIASNVIHEARFVRKSKELLKKFGWPDLRLLQEFFGEEEDIDKAISLLTPAIAEEAQARLAADMKRAKRAEISADYNTIFMALGRRDGFACAICGNMGSDLQIDHKMPVSRDGSNDLDNLQLLCRPCNIVKGAKV